MPVQLGDTILVSAAEVDQSKADPIEIKWQQSLSDRSGKYIQAKFTVVKTAQAGGNTGDETESVIFIQFDKLDAFSKKQIQGSDVKYTIVIDKTFVYGQKNQEGDGRWLVFHDTSRNPFQHRFIQSALQKGASKVAGIIAKTLGAGGTETQLAALFGHPLRTF